MINLFRLLYLVIRFIATRQQLVRAAFKHRFQERHRELHGQASNLCNPKEMHQLHCMPSQLQFTWILSSICGTSKYLCFCLFPVGERPAPRGYSVHWPRSMVKRAYTCIARGNRTINYVWLIFSFHKLATKMYYVFIFVPVLKLSLKETEKA